MQFISVMAKLILQHHYSMILQKWFLY